MANFTPNEIIIYDDKDPSWINNRIKKIVHERNSFYKDYKSNDIQISEISTLLQKIFACRYGAIKGYLLFKS